MSRRPRSSSRVLSSAEVKWALHTMMACVTAPSAMKWIISQVASGIHRCAMDTMIAATNQPTTA